MHFCCMPSSICSFDCMLCSVTVVLTVHSCSAVYRFPGLCHSHIKSCILTDCLSLVQRFLTPERLATKSVDGRMCIWDMAARRQLSTWKVSIPPVTRDVV